MLLQMGGLKETFELFEMFEEAKLPLDFEVGIQQAIGYKEFYPFYYQMKYEWGPDALQHIKELNFEHNDLN